MEVYECGIWVTIKAGNVRGLITAIIARFDQVRYEVTYYDGERLHRAVMHESEFIAGEVEENRKVGFK